MNSSGKICYYCGSLIQKTKPHKRCTLPKDRYNYNKFCCKECHEKSKLDRDTRNAQYYTNHLENYPKLSNFTIKYLLKSGAKSTISTGQLLANGLDIEKLDKQYTDYLYKNKGFAGNKETFTP